MTNPPRKSTIWHAYKTHERNARAREIDFLFTFEEWREWWLTDDRWSNRGGARDQFVMARDGDTGPYADWNVHLATNGENARELVGRPQIKRAASGVRGVTKARKGWRARIARPGEPTLHIGYFATLEAAAAAIEAHPHALTLRAKNFLD